MTDISPAFSPSEKGVILTIEVSAGAKRAVFPAGYNEWRRAVECSVKAPASGGRANREVVAIISATLRIKKNRVRILTGETSPVKKILIEDGDREVLIHIISASLPPG